MFTLNKSRFSHAHNGELLAMLYMDFATFLKPGPGPVEFG